MKVLCLSNLIQCVAAIYSRTSSICDAMSRSASDVNAPLTLPACAVSQCFCPKYVAMHRKNLAKCCVQFTSCATHWTDWWSLRAPAIRQLPLDTSRNAIGWYDSAA